MLAASVASTAAASALLASVMAASRRETDSQRSSFLSSLSAGGQDRFLQRQRGRKYESRGGRGQPARTLATALPSEETSSVNYPPSAARVCVCGDGCGTPRSLDSFSNVSVCVQFNQTDGKKNRYVPDDFEMDDDFKRLVSYNTTAVHIPTDIYEGCESSAPVL